MQVVPDRGATTLLEIIFQMYEEGSIIYSDCWSSYQKISKLKELLIIRTIFLDPVTGVCMLPSLISYSLTY